mgnify:CR=1 FL=1
MVNELEIASYSTVIVSARPTRLKCVALITIPWVVVAFFNKNYSCI